MFLRQIFPRGGPLIFVEEDGTRLLRGGGGEVAEVAKA
jgi:hypothetical protein